MHQESATHLQNGLHPSLAMLQKTYCKSTNQSLASGSRPKADIKTYATIGAYILSTTRQ